MVCMQFSESVVLLFCAGATLVGELDRSGIGKPVSCDMIASLGALWQNRRASNQQVLCGLREDEHAAWLLEATRKDASLGRMSSPLPVHLDGFDAGLLHPRFAVCKSLPDGSSSLRAVDHFSWSADGAGKEGSTNGHTFPQEKLSHDTLDTFGEVACVFKAKVWIALPRGMGARAVQLRCRWKRSLPCSRLMSAQLSAASRCVHGTAGQHGLRSWSLDRSCQCVCALRLL